MSHHKGRRFGWQKADVQASPLLRS